MSEKTKLPPCPFHTEGCDTAISIRDFKDGGQWFKVEWDCGASGPECGSRENAIREAALLKT